MHSSLHDIKQFCKIIGRLIIKGYSKWKKRLVCNTIYIIQIKIAIPVVELVCVIVFIIFVKLSTNVNILTIHEKLKRQYVHS